MVVSRLSTAIALLWVSAAPLMPAWGRPNVPLETPTACQTITQQDINNTGRTTAAEALEKLPASPMDCPAPNSRPPSHPSPFDQRILDAQNVERINVGVAPLRWNDELAQHATEYAQVLARTGQLIHAPRDGRGIERENLQQGIIGWSPERMIQNWTKEKSLFHAGLFPNVCNGDWTQCAHYTQVIWPTTTDVGCGQAQGLGFNWFVCRYSPGGNKDGKPVGMPLQIASSPPPPPTGDTQLDGSRFATTGHIDHDFKYGFAYRNTPVSSQSAWDGSGSISDDFDLWTLANTGSISVLPVGDTGSHLWSGLNTDLVVSDPLGSIHRRSDIAYFDVSANAWCLGVFICGGMVNSQGYVGSWNNDVVFSSPAPLTVDLTLGDEALKEAQEGPPPTPPAIDLVPDISPQQPNPPANPSSDYIANWNNDVIFPSAGIPSDVNGSGAAMVFTLTGNTNFPSVAVNNISDSSAPSSIPVMLAGQDVLDDFIMNIPAPPQPPPPDPLRLIYPPDVM